MESTTFNIAGDPIEQKYIRHLWEQTRNELKDRYPKVKDIPMPKISAMTLGPENFRRQHRQLLQSKHIRDTGLIEWGSPSTMKTSDLPSACVFEADEDQGWIILKRTGKKSWSIENDLIHELFHVWESALGLRWGTLSRKKTPDEDMRLAFPHAKGTVSISQLLGGDQVEFKL
jgi:hypothetical protein